MPTTSNFGWTTPADTDLVKDGAAAIRTLGNGIDTSLVDLKGGTTGQVLSKTSGTDMDFTWVTTDDANAIQNAIVDAKGDLIAASAADTPARLAVGSNGETLVCDSAASVGLRYTSGVGLTQPVVNGGMDVWQRGTSINATSNNTYTADRWTAGGNANALTVSRQSTNDTTNLPTIQYCARVQRDSGNTNTAARLILQNVETANTYPFIGKTVTLSFWARKGADYSSASDALTVRLTTGTGTDQSAFSGFTGVSNVIDSNVTLTTTWQRFSLTGTIATTALEMAPSFRYTPVGTAGAADYFEFTGVQIDVGNVALPFRRSGGTIQGELAACQRYYFRNTGASIYLGSGGIAGSTTQCYVQVKHPTTMRVAPTVLDSSLLLLQIITGSTNVTSASISSATPDLTLILATVASGLTATTQSYMLMTQNTATAHLGLSAEL